MPVNLQALQELCTALTSATLDDAENSMSAVDFIKVMYVDITGHHQSQPVQSHGASWVLSHASAFQR
jgi:hypothetical protein